ncbi:uncharacterized protein BDV14DRAFT_101224 [Aspergillus stella-maris]|uniref:uncharacterized protein n=1 Tax=Aspergillus stella-maris TaxID=1810926 RepID=UPI003CCE0452
MAVQDRPRGLRVPSLSSFRSKNKNAAEPQPTIQLPSPSQMSLATDSIPGVSSFSPVSPADKALPPQPFSSPSQHSIAGANPYPSPPQAYNGRPTPSHAQSSSPSQAVGADIASLPRQAPPPNKPIPLPPQFQAPPPRRPSPRSAAVPAPTPAQAPAPAPAAAAPAPEPVVAQAPTSVYAPVPVPPVNPTPAIVQQRTPPLSDSEPEQRLSNNTNDSLEDIIPSPETEAAPELSTAGGTPNEAPSSEEDDRPFTPPEVEPVAVPLNKLHYSCYQDHRAMHKAGNVWYALPCMACQKFDREIRHRCVFCCLRVCSRCFEELKKMPRRSLAQLMETIEVPLNGVSGGEAAAQPVAL